MKILSHRGYWKAPHERNTAVAFERSFSLGFGTETDLRDLSGKLVISHDLPTSDAVSADNFFENYCREYSHLDLALNVKSDGLQELLLDLIEKHSIENYFLFDMSIPDALVCLRRGLKCFTRQSEYEQDPAFYQHAEGIWIDGFHGEWWDYTLIRRHLDVGKKVCIVSPDLHRRPHLPFWEKLAKWDNLSDSALMLCTDFPEEAAEIFDESPGIPR